MAEEKEQVISKYFYEDITAKLERTIEKLWIVVILLIVLLVGSNGAWLWHESQYVDTETTYTQDIDTVSGNATIFDGIHVNDGEN